MGHQLQDSLVSSSAINLTSFGACHHGNMQDLLTMTVDAYTRKSDYLTSPALLRKIDEHYRFERWHIRYFEHMMKYKDAVNDPKNQARAVLIPIFRRLKLAPIRLRECLSLSLFSLSMLFYLRGR